MAIQDVFEQTKPYVLDPLLTALYKDRFAFSEVEGWRIRAASPEEAKHALQVLLEEELLRFVADVCCNAPRPYGATELVAFLSVCEESENATPLAKGTVGFNPLELEERKRAISDFYLDHLAELKVFIVVREVISLGRYYGWLLGLSSSKKSMPESFIRQQNSPAASGPLSSLIAS